MAELKNITGALLIDATAAFLNGAGLGAGEDRNMVIPKTFRESIGGRNEEVPYVSAQAWRRWLRNTANEENKWDPSELQAIAFNARGNTSKIATQLNPVTYPEDDLFGYMRSGGNEIKDGGEDGEEGEETTQEQTKKPKAKAESVQRTSPFKCSILKGVRGKRAFTTDEGFVHLKDGSPLPYSTKFYSSHLEGFFNLEYYRLGVFDNLGSKMELASEVLAAQNSKLEESSLGGKYKRYVLKDADKERKERAAGLLKGLAYLRGGAKQAAFGADVSPKVLVLAGLECANPVFNNLFDGNAETPALRIETLKQIIADYQEKLATPVYIGIRDGYLSNEDKVKELSNGSIIVGSPVSVVNDFINKHLSNGA